MPLRHAKGMVAPPIMMGGGQKVPSSPSTLRRRSLNLNLQQTTDPITHLLLDIPRPMLHILALPSRRRLPIRRSITIRQDMLSPHLRQDTGSINIRLLLIPQLPSLTLHSRPGHSIQVYHPLPHMEHLLGHRNHMGVTHIRRKTTISLSRLGQPTVDHIRKALEGTKSETSPDRSSLIGIPPLHHPNPNLHRRRQTRHRSLHLLCRHW